MDMVKFGAIVRQRREELGWTQELLAERLGKSLGYVSQLECGRIGAKIDTFQSLIQLLTLDANAVFYDVEEVLPYEKETTFMLSQLDSSVRDFIINSIRLSYYQKFPKNKNQEKTSRKICLIFQ